MSKTETIARLTAEARQHLEEFRSTQALALVREALALDRPTGPSTATAELYALAAQCHYVRDDFGSAMAAGIDAFRTAPHDDEATQAHALFGIAVALMGVRACEEVLVAGRKAERAARHAGIPLLRARVLATIAAASFETGDLVACVAANRRAARLYATTGHGARRAKMIVNLGNAYSRLAKRCEEGGDGGQAQRFHRRALRTYEEAERLGPVASDGVICLSGRAQALFRMGEIERAVALIDQACEQAAREKLRLFEAICLVMRARVREQAGHRQSVENDLRRALEIAEGREGAYVLVEAHEAAASHHGAVGDGARARHHAERALEIAAEREALRLRTRAVLLEMWEPFAGAGLGGGRAIPALPEARDSPATAATRPARPI